MGAGTSWEGRMGGGGGGRGGVGEKRRGERGSRMTPVNMLGQPTVTAR